MILKNIIHRDTVLKTVEILIINSCIFHMFTPRKPMHMEHTQSEKSEKNKAFFPKAE